MDRKAGWAGMVMGMATQGKQHMHTCTFTPPLVHVHVHIVCQANPSLCKVYQETRLHTVGVCVCEGKESFHGCDAYDEHVDNCL